MDLNELLQTERKPRHAWIDFKGFEIQVKYVDRLELNKLVDKSKIKAWKRHQQTEEVSDPLLLKNIATLVLDWRGLTLGKLATLIDINIDGQDVSADVPCTDTNKIVLLENLYDFDNFLFDTVTDLQMFRQEQLDLEKKTLPDTPRPASS